MKKYIIPFLLTGVLVACSNDEVVDVEKAEHTHETIKTEVQQVDEAGNEVIEEEKPVTNDSQQQNEVEKEKEVVPAEDNSAAEVPEVEVKEQNGIFFGLADSTSVEIEVNGEPNTYLFDESLFHTVNELPSESEVTFTYKQETNGQKLITNIQIKN